MKNIFMVLVIGALVLGSILTVGILTEQNKPQPTVVFYETPAPLPTQAQYEQAVATPMPSGTTAYAVLRVNPMEGR